MLPEAMKIMMAEQATSARKRLQKRQPRVPPSSKWETFSLAMRRAEVIPPRTTKTLPE
jgi:hypothetical protein